MENKYLLTLAIPSYNRAKFLERALQTIFEQNDARIEILVSDNCSDDDTDMIVSKFKHFKNIRYIKNMKNIGADNNFLQCYRKACGKYVMLLGSDDVILKGSIKHILEFLESHEELQWVFLNHVFFENQFVNVENCKSAFMFDSGDFVTENKMLFMQAAKYQVTFLSCHILNKKIINKVKNPEKYVGTYFLHTNVAFEGTAGSGGLYGVITRCCVAQDQTTGNSSIDVGNNFLIFGKWMKYSLCHVAVNSGYKKKQMSRIYINRLCEYWPQMLITLKAGGNVKWEPAFWEYAYPEIKYFLKGWFMIIPTVFVPKRVAKWIVKNIKPLYKKIRSKNAKQVY